MSMSPSDYDLHLGLCEFALRGFSRPCGRLQKSLKRFSDASTRHEKTLQHADKSFSTDKPYFCLDALSRELLKPCNVSCSNVLILYVFLSRVSVEYKFDTKIVASILWNNGLERFIQTHGWNHFQEKGIHFLGALLIATFLACGAYMCI